MDICASNQQCIYDNMRRQPHVSATDQESRGKNSSSDEVGNPVLNLEAYVRHSTQSAVNLPEGENAEETVSFTWTDADKPLEREEAPVSNEQNNEVSEVRDSENEWNFRSTAVIVLIPSKAQEPLVKIATTTKPARETPTNEGQEVIIHNQVDKTREADTTAVRSVEEAQTNRIKLTNYYNLGEEAKEPATEVTGINGSAEERLALQNKTVSIHDQLEELKGKDRVIEIATSVQGLSTHNQVEGQKEESVDVTTAVKPAVEKTSQESGNFSICNQVEEPEEVFVDVESAAYQTEESSTREAKELSIYSCLNGPSTLYLFANKSTSPFSKEKSNFVEDARNDSFPQGEISIQTEETTSVIPTYEFYTITKPAEEEIFSAGHIGHEFTHDESNKAPDKNLFNDCAAELIMDYPVNVQSSAVAEMALLNHAIQQPSRSYEDELIDSEISESFTVSLPSCFPPDDTMTTSFSLPSYDQKASKTDARDMHVGVSLSNATDVSNDDDADPTVVLLPTRGQLIEHKPTFSSTIKSEVAEDPTQIIEIPRVMDLSSTKSAKFSKTENNSEENATHHSPVFSRFTKAEHADLTSDIESDVENSSFTNMRHAHVLEKNVLTPYGNPTASMDEKPSTSKQSDLSKQSPVNEKLSTGKVEHTFPETVTDYKKHQPVFSQQKGPLQHAASTASDLSDSFQTSDSAVHLDADQQHNEKTTKNKGNPRKQKRLPKKQEADVSSISDYYSVESDKNDGYWSDVPIGSAFRERRLSDFLYKNPPRPPDRKESKGVVPDIRFYLRAPDPDLCSSPPVSDNVSPWSARNYDNNETASMTSSMMSDIDGADLRAFRNLSPSPYTRGRPGENSELLNADESLEQSMTDSVASTVSFSDLEIPKTSYLSYSMLSDQLPISNNPSFAKNNQNVSNLLHGENRTPPMSPVQQWLQAMTSTKAEIDSEFAMPNRNPNVQHDRVLQAKTSSAGQLDAKTKLADANTKQLASTQSRTPTTSVKSKISDKISFANPDKAMISTATPWNKMLDSRRGRSKMRRSSADPNKADSSMWKQFIRSVSTDSSPQLSLLKDIKKPIKQMLYSNHSGSTLDKVTQNGQNKESTQKRSATQNSVAEASSQPLHKPITIPKETSHGHEEARQGVPQNDEIRSLIVSHSGKTLTSLPGSKALSNPQENVAPQTNVPFSKVQIDKNSDTDLVSLLGVKMKKDTVANEETSAGWYKKDSEKNTVDKSTQSKSGSNADASGIQAASPYKTNSDGAVTDSLSSVRHSVDKNLTSPPSYNSLFANDWQNHDRPETSKTPINPEIVVRSQKLQEEINKILHPIPTNKHDHQAPSTSVDASKVHDSIQEPSKLTGYTWQSDGWLKPMSPTVRDVNAVSTIGSFSRPDDPTRKQRPLGDSLHLSDKTLQNFSATQEDENKQKTDGIGIMPYAKEILNYPQSNQPETDQEQGIREGAINDYVIGKSTSAFQNSTPSLISIAQPRSDCNSTKKSSAENSSFYFPRNLLPKENLSSYPSPEHVTRDTQGRDTDLSVNQRVAERTGSDLNDATAIPHQFTESQIMQLSDNKSMPKTFSQKETSQPSAPESHSTTADPSTAWLKKMTERRNLLRNKGVLGSSPVPTRKTFHNRSVSEPMLGDMTWKDLHASLDNELSQKPPSPSMIPPIPHEAKRPNDNSVTPAQQESTYKPINASKVTNKDGSVSFVFKEDSSRDNLLETSKDRANLPEYPKFASASDQFTRRKPPIYQPPGSFGVHAAPIVDDLPKSGMATYKQPTVKIPKSTRPVPSFQREWSNAESTSPPLSPLRSPGRYFPPITTLYRVSSEPVLSTLPADSYKTLPAKPIPDYDDDYNKKLEDSLIKKLEMNSYTDDEDTEGLFMKPAYEGSPEHFTRPFSPKSDEQISQVRSPSPFLETGRSHNYVNVQPQKSASNVFSDKNELSAPIYSKFPDRPPLTLGQPIIPVKFIPGKFSQSSSKNDFRSHSFPGFDTSINMPSTSETVSSKANNLSTYQPQSAETSSFGRFGPQTNSGTSTRWPATDVEVPNEKYMEKFTEKPSYTRGFSELANAAATGPQKMATEEKCNQEHLYNDAGDTFSRLQVNPLVHPETRDHPSQLHKTAPSFSELRRVDTELQENSGSIPTTETSDFKSPNSDVSTTTNNIDSVKMHLRDNSWIYPAQVGMKQDKAEQSDSQDAMRTKQPRSRIPVPINRIQSNREQKLAKSTPRTTDVTQRENAEVKTTIPDHIVTFYSKQPVTPKQTHLTEKAVGDHKSMSNTETSPSRTTRLDTNNFQVPDKITIYRKEPTDIRNKSRSSFPACNSAQQLVNLSQREIPIRRANEDVGAMHYGNLTKRMSSSLPERLDMIGNSHEDCSTNTVRESSNNPASPYQRPAVLLSSNVPMSYSNRNANEQQVQSNDIIKSSGRFPELFDALTDMHTKLNSASEQDEVVMPPTSNVPDYCTLPRKKKAPPKRLSFNPQVKVWNYEDPSSDSSSDDKTPKLRSRGHMAGRVAAANEQFNREIDQDKQRNAILPTSTAPDYRLPDSQIKEHYEVPPYHGGTILNQSPVVKTFQSEPSFDEVQGHDISSVDYRDVNLQKKPLPSEAYENWPLPGDDKQILPQRIRVNEVVLSTPGPPGTTKRIPITLIPSEFAAHPEWHAGFFSDPTRSSFTDNAEVSTDLEHLEKICSQARPNDRLAVQRRVFIWDLDETILLFQSLLTGSFARKYGKDREMGIQLGKQMEELLFTVLVSHFFYDDLSPTMHQHVYDVPGLVYENGRQNGDQYYNEIDPQIREEDKWLLIRYRRIQKLYNAYQHNLTGLLDPPLREQWLNLITSILNYCDGWMTLAKEILTLILSRPHHVNVLVTQTRLLPALAKLMLYNLAAPFSIENVYSAARGGKRSCFERIATRFGHDSYFMVIGDGKEEEAAAKQMNFPFWKISSRSSLEIFRRALESRIL